MLDFKKLESVLEDQIVRTVAAVGVLLILAGIIESVLFRLGSAVGSTAIFNGFWNLTWISILATLAAGGLWAGLAVTSNYEQPWWMIVGGALAGWNLIITPVAFELPDFLLNLVLLVGVVVQLAGVVLAIALLDKAIPRATTSFAGAGAGPAGPGAGAGGGAPAGQSYGQQGYGGAEEYDSRDYETQQYQGGGYEAEQESSGGTPPGWYPDPHGEGTSRWWDGNAWSRNVR